LLVVVAVAEQEMDHNSPIQVEEVVLVLIEQTVHLFLVHKQYLFKLVQVVREHLLLQILVKE
jgi:hypothetical protein